VEFLRFGYFLPIEVSKCVFLSQNTLQHITELWRPIHLSPHIGTSRVVSLRVLQHLCSGPVYKKGAVGEYRFCIGVSIRHANGAAMTWRRSYHYSSVRTADPR
jgi:hypothetical protein